MLLQNPAYRHIPPKLDRGRGERNSPPAIDQSRIGHADAHQRPPVHIRLRDGDLGAPQQLGDDAFNSVLEVRRLEDHVLHLPAEIKNGGHHDVGVEFNRSDRAVILREVQQYLLPANRVIRWSAFD